ncbi:MAG TPA: ABC transporter permease [Vicinamibacterales bacterium]|nr:ABC transporter permease [Vicinamibacterales bacterium]
MDYRDRIRAEFAGRPAPDEDVIEELAEHAAALYRSARAEGCSREEAERRLQGQLSAWTQDAARLQRRTRRLPAPVPPPAWGAGIAGAGDDVRYALRTMRREPGQASLVVATIALGIAAATVLFSVTYAVLLKPLPWPEADRLVRLYESRQGATRPPAYFTNAAYLAWRERPATIEALGGWSVSRRIVRAGGEPERMPVVAVTPSLFDVLRARPERGSLFARDGDTPTDARQALISRGFWLQRFGGRADALGRVLELDGERFRLVGIMPERFAFPDRESRIWVPFRIRPVIGPESGSRSLSMFGALARLRPGVTPAQAAAEASARGRSAPDAGPVAVAVFGSNGPVEVTAVALVDAMAGEVRPALAIFMGAVALLLATGIANVAGLQLARAVARRREIAVRAAIGAGGARLMRQLLTESVLLGVFGGAAGLALAAWLHRALPSLLPADFPRIGDVALDWRVASFAIGSSVLAGALFGLLPALQARRVDLVATLNEDALAPVGASMRTPVARARAAIMACQIAVACVLLVGAVLLARSFLALSRADRGYDPANVLTARVVLPEGSFTPAARAEALRVLLERLRALAGVRRAAFSNALPLSGGEMLASFPMRSPRTGAEVQVQTSVRHVSPDYFAAMGIRLKQGRGFLETEDERMPLVRVVNEAFARRYLDATPIGERLPAARADTPVEAVVVGVIEDVREGSITAPPQPEMYVSSRQLPTGVLHDDPMVVLRTAWAPAGLVPELRALLRDVAPGALLENVMTMEDRLRADLARPRLYAVLLGAFAAFAVLIAAVGLFGVLAYVVAQRSREIGVRAALGATPRAIVALIVRQALWVSLAGIIAGLAISLVAVRWLATLLYGVEPRDGASFAVVAVALLVLSALATWVPARRAASVDPLKVLR